MTARPCPVPKCEEITAQPVCDHHRARVIAALARALVNYDDLGLALAPAAGGGQGERVSTGEVIRLPINADARALQEDLTRHLVRAWEDVAGVRTGTLVGRERSQLSFASHQLATVGHFQAALTLDGFASRLLDLSRQADRLLGRQSPPKRLPTPCGSCGCLALERPAGEEHVQCRACGDLYSPSDYQRWTLAIIDHQNRTAA